MPLNRVYQDSVRASQIWGYSRPAANGIAVYTALKGVTAVLTGTATPSATEAEIVAGGQTIIITLTDVTWVPAGAEFNAVRQAIINGMVSDGDEPTGWNAELLVGLITTSGVVRTSDTVVTVTTSSDGGYSITENEIVTVTVPVEALVGAASPLPAGSFTVIA